MKTGAERIAAERQRQVDKLGWTPEHDDEHGHDMALAAACYASPVRLYRRDEYAASVSFSDPFPWAAHEDARPHNGNVLKDPTDKQRLRLLEKAGALIAAEIDRMLRDASRVSSQAGEP